MINYSKRNINVVSLIISIPIIIIILIILNQNKIKNASISKILNNNIIEIEMKSESMEKETKEEVQNPKIPNNEINQNNQNNLNLQQIQNSNWTLEIPKINLNAKIEEGTTKEVLDNFIGHFEKTSKNEGNIALAAHNRGYRVNYFREIKKLKKGDVVIYRYYDVVRKYEIVENIIVEDTDWSYLENTRVNSITLITCVEDEPDYRRCVYGIESM